MLRAGLAFLMVAWPALADVPASAPCPIQRGAAAGPHVWLLCERKTIFVSADDGVTWQTRSLPSQARFRAVALLDSRRGFVAGDEGTLLATEDSAETWRQVPLPSRENLTSLFFLGEHGWAAGWGGVILHSSDRGTTWERQQNAVRQGLDAIFFADADHGWAVGWAATILRTSNGGQTWEQVKVPQASWSLSSVYFRDTKRGWVVGFNGHILCSDDGGLSWEQQASPVQSWLTWVAFDSSGRGWIAADNRILVSEDGGETWRAIAVERTLFLHQVLAVNDSLWAVGQLGVLRRAGGESEFTALDILPDAGARTPISGIREQTHWRWNHAVTPVV